MNAIALRGGSKLEREFALRWSTLKAAPALSREVRFHNERKWRFDFANTDAKVAIELDGGIWRGSSGGHTSGAGIQRDREKDFAATMAGWLVVRLTPQMAKDRSMLEQIAELISKRTDPYFVKGKT